jgi:ABC-2 type transport system permease protein
MIDAIRAEWIKLRTARSNLVLLILAVVVPVAFTLLITSVISKEDATNNDLFDLLLAGAGIGQILIGVLGVLIIGQEYRHTTIRITFTADPRRSRVMLAKAIVVVVTGLAVGVVAVGFSYALGNAILTSRAFDLLLDGHTQARAALGAVVLFGLSALVGLGVGSIIRATAGAITLFVLWPIVVENLIDGLLPKVGKWLPFRAGGELMSTSSTTTTDTLSPVAGGLLFAIFGFALLAVGIVLVTRRDA